MNPIPLMLVQAAIQELEMFWTEVSLAAKSGLNHTQLTPPPRKSGPAAKCRPHPNIRTKKRSSMLFAGGLSTKKKDPWPLSDRSCHSRKTLPLRTGKLFRASKSHLRFIITEYCNTARASDFITISKSPFSGNSLPAHFAITFCTLSLPRISGCIAEVAPRRSLLLPVRRYVDTAKMLTRPRQMHNLWGDYAAIRRKCCQLHRMRKDSLQDISSCSSTSYASGLSQQAEYMG